MRHLGDITHIHGDEIEPVDCITGGSPCQNLSVAGNREGLSGSQSRLFLEQIRIVKEMREHERASGRTADTIRPRYMVWENVLGAFSSNGGEDFRAVLTEIVRIAEPESPDVPMPEKKWPRAGCLYDELEGWSVAWRVHDAQFWGVPQRRKRIALIADFRGLSAPEVLFERKGLSRYSAEGRTQREEVAGAVREGLTSAGFNGYKSVTGSIQYAEELCPTIERNTPPDVICMATQQGGAEIMEDKSPTITAAAGMSGNNQPVICLQGNVIGRADTAGCNGKGWTEDVCYTLNTVDRPAVFDARGNGDGEIVPTITGDHNNRITDYTALCIGNGQLNQISMSEQANTLDAMHDQQAIMVPDVARTLKAKANCDFREDSETYIVQTDTVRRFTPLECERLQNFPDGWTDIGEWIDGKGRKRKTSDSARYKALGNSIALPFWQWLMKRISAQYERPATLGSLFDGIGGFPLCWARVNGAKYVRWASEIEEFPIAVTKRHFGDEDTGEKGDLWEYLD